MDDGSDICRGCGDKRKGNIGKSYDRAKRFYKTLKNFKKFQKNYCKIKSFVV